MTGSPFKQMSVAPRSYGEILSVAVNRAMRASAKLRADRVAAARRLYSARIKTAGEYLCDRISRIYSSTPMIAELHPFYRDLASVLVDVDAFRVSLARLKAATRIISGIMRETRRKALRAANVRVARAAWREFLGRVSSVLEEFEDDLRRVRECQIALARLPDIDVDSVTIVVAGPPNVGKSSFVRRVSTGRPEVREYPFTTKTLNLGHLVFSEDFKVQVLDTPGLLDRPLSERNRVEQQGILALRHLADSIVFVLDPSETCGFPREYQLNVLGDVQRHFGGTPLLVALNKLDLAAPGAVEAFKSSVGGCPVYGMSVLRGDGVINVLKAALALAGVPAYYIDNFSFRLNSLEEA